DGTPVVRLHPAGIIPPALGRGEHRHRPPRPLPDGQLGRAGGRSRSGLGGGVLMPRLMSVSLTEQAVLERRKTVTRRLGWKFLKRGDRLTLCRKVMGRKKGEPLVRLAEVEVVDVRREPLWNISRGDVQ